MMALYPKLFIAFFVFLSWVKDGDAGATSSFTRSQWPAVDMPLDNKQFAVPNGYNAPQQVNKCICRVWVVVIA